MVLASLKYVIGSTSVKDAVVFYLLASVSAVVPTPVWRV